MGQIHYKNFEYKILNKDSFMTAEAAVKLCEIDSACGGFTFHGIDIPDKKHNIFFVHFIPFDGIKIYGKDSFLWNTYRSRKTILRLPGKVKNLDKRINFTLFFTHVKKYSQINFSCQNYIIFAKLFSSSH